MFFIDFHQFKGSGGICV